MAGWKQGKRRDKVEEKGRSFADICPHRHHWQWCTFFKLVPFVAQRMRNLGLSWPILAILSGGVSKLTNIRYESEKDLKVPEECDQAS